MTCPMSLNRFRALYSAKRARFGDLGDATEEIYNQATRAGKGLEELFTTGGYETPVLGDRGDAASSYYAPKQGQYSEGGASTGNDYGPSAADCEAAGAAYDPTTGQCVSKTPTAGGTQFKPVPTEEIPDGGEEDLPPWVREGIAKCQLEDKLFDAATGECVDDPDASKDQPRRSSGGGGGGGGRAKKKTDGGDEPMSKAYVVGLSALSGAVATGVAATATSLAMKGRHTAAVGAGGALLGALAGGVLAFAISDR